MRPIDTCSSCGVRLIDRGGTVFGCPNCGETHVGRCPQCRDQGVAYRCSACSFSGP